MVEKVYTPVELFPTMLQWATSNLSIGQLGKVHPMHVVSKGVNPFVLLQAECGMCLFVRVAKHAQLLPEVGRIASVRRLIEILYRATRDVKLIPRINNFYIIGRCLSDCTIGGTCVQKGARFLC